MTVLKHARSILLLILMLALVSLLWGFLAPLRINFTWPVSEHKNPPPPSAAQGAPFVGLALSGGGARAAIFGAAGMQALAERDLLASITHVSSVSGGGFPAAYLATHPIDACVNEQNADARKTCFKTYFEQMQRVLRRNYLLKIEVNQLLNPIRLFSPSRRISSLVDALDHPQFIAGKPLGRINDGRSYLFNTVSYDTGRRFVISNAALPPIDAGKEHRLPAGLRALSFSEPAEPLEKTAYTAKSGPYAAAVRTSQGTTHAAPDNFPIALAVAASAAFPPYLGPMTIHKDTKSADADQFWHLGDGGVLENSGVETLREMVLARPELNSAMIYAFNGGLKLDKSLTSKALDMSIWSREVSRLVDVILEYAGATRLAFEAEIDAREGLSIQVTDFDFLTIETLLKEQTLDPRLKQQWDDWPASCAGKSFTKHVTPAAHLKEIPTSFRITGCNADLMERAARFLVAVHLD